MKKVIFAVVAGSLLSGCVTQKPPLSDSQYTAFATQLIGIHKCVASGNMPPDTGARGQQYSMANLNTWQFDQNYFMSRAKQIADSVNPSQGDCNTLAMNIMQRKIRSRPKISRPHRKHKRGKTCKISRNRIKPLIAIK
ncbi:hypothetical protein VRC12_07070 [Pseudomonas poae]|uniref:hypothetical protein n=1 Tax=Pseudomonas poae TaxID=200451 RepID=UPI003D9BBF3E